MNSPFNRAQCPTQTDEISPKPGALSTRALRNRRQFPVGALSIFKRERRQIKRRARRGGQVLVYVSLIFVLLLGVCAIVIDEGYWFQRRAEMQKATDAAVMAGAGALISGDKNTAEARALDEAYRYAKINGFDRAVAGITVTAQDDPAAKEFHVNINQPNPTFFGSVFGTHSVNISTSATAKYDRPSQVLIPITGGNYGVNTGPINIGLYGPNQITNRGDLYSARYTTNSQGQIVPNPLYRPEGYSFAVTLDASFTGNSATVQIYDADSTASGADSTADNKVWDENNKDVYGPLGQGFGRTGRNETTVTRYTLFSDGGTPFDPTDDVEIQSRDIGDDASYDRQWKDFFTWDPTTYRASKPGTQFRLQAQTIAGSNENGFNVRVTRPGDTDATFSSGGGNGTNVSAIGDLPVNFGRTGTGEVLLGYVPPGATQVRVDHFDSDVGVNPGDRIQYSYSANGTGAPTQTFFGNPLLGSAADNVTETDTIDLSGYGGGVWKARYSAGGSDNTTWKLTYDGPPSGAPGSIRLVK